MSSSCVRCGKLFSEKTFARYDGKNCGKCYKKTTEVIEESIPVINSSESITGMDSEDNIIDYILGIFKKCCMIRDESSPRINVTTDVIEQPIISGKNKRQVIPKKIRNEIWNIWISSTSQIGACFVCDNEININNFHAAHVLADKHGGDPTIINLRPTCSLCNTSMGTMNLFQYIEKFGLESNKRKLLPIDAKNLIDSMPTNWTRNNVIKSVDSILDLFNIDNKNEFRQFVLYITWIIFIIPEKRPDHIDMLLITINQENVPTISTNRLKKIKDIIYKTQTIFQNWYKHRRDSVVKDLNYYSVYLEPYDIVIMK